MIVLYKSGRSANRGERARQRTAHQAAWVLMAGEVFPMNTLSAHLLLAKVDDARDLTEAVKN